MFNKLRGVLACALFVAIAACSVAAPALADTEVIFDNGIIVNVPEYWNVEIVPEGFNSGAFDRETNITGKLPGFGGWPLRDLVCAITLSENDFSPVSPAYEVCTSEGPTFLTPAEPQYDFYDIDEDGVIDFGPNEGCTYDPFDESAAGSPAQYDCS